MKLLLAFSVLAMTSLSAQASVYNCTLSDGSGSVPKAISYQIDTDKEDNKFVAINESSSVGCVVLRATPQLLTCGLGSGQEYSMFATGEDGTSTLGLYASGQGHTTNLNCIKQ